MSEEKKSSTTGVPGVTFAEKKEDTEHAAPPSILELYDRPLAALSKPHKKDVRVFGVENAFDGKSIDAGTIVSDRKQDRPSFVENVADAFSEWFGNTTRTLRAYNIVPQKKVAPKTESRTAAPVKKVASVPAVTTAPRTPKDTHTSTTHIPKMRTMPHTTLPASSVPPSEKKEDTDTVVSSARSPLLKMRTFKDDAARARAASPVPQSESSNTHKQSPTVPEKTASTPAVEPTVPTATPDLRETFVAPEVTTRLKADAASFAPKQKEETIARPHQHISTEPKRTYELSIPDVVPVPKKEPVVQPAKKETAETTTHAETPTVSQVPVQTPKESVPQWTHVVSDSEPLKTPVIRTPARSEVTAPPDNLPTLRESTAPILPHETRTIASRDIPTTPPPETPRVPEFVPTPVKLHEEQRTLSKKEMSVSPQDVAPFHSTTTPTIETSQATTPSVRITSVSHAPQAPTNFIRFALRIIMGLFGTGAIIVLGAYLLVRPGEPRTEEPTSPLPVSSTETSTSTTAGIALTGTRAAFLNTLRTEIMNAPAGFTSLDLTAGTEGRPATAQEFFAHLEVSLLDRAVRSLEPAFTIGTITTTRNEPFMVIQTNNFDVLFAGLLAWEPRMQQELAPLFGAARTNETLFEDAVRDNKSIRILRDEAGEEILLYSFIQERTVVITTSGEALAALIQQL